MKRVLTAVIALVTVAAASGGPKAAEPCSELRQASNSATMQVPAGAMVSEIESDGVFGCQHLYDARKAGPLDQLSDTDLRSGECARFAKGEHVYSIDKGWSSTTTDPDGRRISPSLYSVRRVGGGPTYYVVGDPPL
jgi:hypothetical protein